MTDIDKLEALAKDAEWTGEWFYAGCNTVECRYPPSTHNYAGQIDEIAHPVPLNVAPFIAAANPATILALIAEVRALRERLEIDPRHPYDGIACRDETIRLQGEEIARLREDKARLDWAEARKPSIQSPNILDRRWGVFDMATNVFRSDASLREAIDAARGAK